VLCYGRLDHKTWAHFQKINNKTWVHFQKINNSFPQVLEGH
jgi:hypothetical protein